jgi:pyruvate dehydrogenase E2 component (dihydrolipoamide acetyltransferase)
MAEVIKMPKLSDTMTEGVVAKWHKKVGDKVKNGDILADIETDKATMEFESFYDGTLLYIGVEAGKAVPVDSLLAIIGKEGEDVSALIASAQKSEESEATTQKTNGAAEKTVVPAAEKKETKEVAKPEIPSTVNIIRMPKLSDTMTEGVVSKWHKKVGDKVKNGDILADIETDKATMEFESFYDGVLLYTGVEAGKPAPINSLLAIVGKGGEDVSKIVEYEKSVGSKESAVGSEQQSQKSEVKSQKSEPGIEKQEPAKQETKVAATTTVKHASSTNGRIIASPLAKKIAKEKGIDLAIVQGSGDGGRIIKKDIETFTPGGISFSPVVMEEGYTEEPVSQMRKVIAKRLVESKNSAPHFYLTMEIDMDNTIASREAINKISSSKISYNDIVIKACAAALRKHPKVNASWMGDKIRYYKHIHVGMAVALDEGLIVPVIRFADAKSLQQVSAEAKELGKKAKERKLQPSDWEGNTFTVSNLGMFGIEQFTSIINSPESCILAVGGIKQVPVVKNGAVVAGNIMKITLSCDHRVVDGATGAAFLQTLKVFLENPVTMYI